MKCNLPDNIYHIDTGRKILACTHCSSNHNTFPDMIQWPVSNDFFWCELLWLCELWIVVALPSLVPRLLPCRKEPGYERLALPTGPMWLHTRYIEAISLCIPNTHVAMWLETTVNIQKMLPCDNRVVWEWDSPGVVKTCSWSQGCPSIAQESSAFVTVRNTCVRGGRGDTN